MADPLKFYLITDLHHYAPSLGTSGKAYEKWNNKEQKCLAETGAIIDAAFSKLIADKDIDIVLIAGDLTSTGAMESHLDLLPKLQRLRDAGKQVYLITATHDFISSEMEPLRCEGDELLPAYAASEASRAVCGFRLGQSRFRAQGVVFLLRKAQKRI